MRGFAWRAVLALCAAAVAAIAAPAHAATTPVQGRLVAGPVLSGAAAVWAEQLDAERRLQVVAAGNDGVRSVLYATAADPSSACAFVEQLTASAGRVVFALRRGEVRPGGCYDSRTEIIGVGPQGRARSRRWRLPAACRWPYSSTTTAWPSRARAAARPTSLSPSSGQARRPSR